MKEKEILENYQRDLLLSQINETYRLATIRCFSFSEIKERLNFIWKDPYSSKIILSLTERELSIEEENELLLVLKKLADIGDKQKSRDKAKIDRVLSRINKHLSPDNSRKIVLPFLDHPRQARRNIG